MKKFYAYFLLFLIVTVFATCGCAAGEKQEVSQNVSTAQTTDESAAEIGKTENGDNIINSETDIENTLNTEVPPIDPSNVSEGFVFVEGGTFEMGSSEDEPWRSDDETKHTATVGSFYMSDHEAITN